MNYVRNISTNDIHQMMSTPNILSFFVSNSEEVLRYNVGMSSSIYLFISLQERRVYMKYFDSSTGNDVVHIFELLTQTPNVKQLNELYGTKTTNKDECKTDILSEIYKKIDSLEKRIDKGESTNVSKSDKSK